MANQLQCGYESYASIVWANYLGEQNVYRGFANVNPIKQINNTPTECVGSEGVPAQFLGQYPHRFGSDEQETKLREQVWNQTVGTWGAGNFLRYKGHFFRNKAVSWQTFEVNARGTFLIGQHGAYGVGRIPWNGILVQLYPEPAYWNVKVNYQGTKPVNGFVDKIQPDGQYPGGIDVGFRVGNVPIYTYFALAVASGYKFKKPEPVKKTLPSPIGKWRRVDIIQSWGYASSSPFKLFDRSGEGGLCFNPCSGVHIILLDGVEIGRIPCLGDMATPRLHNLYVDLFPSQYLADFPPPAGSGLDGFYPPSSYNMGLRNASAWALNYECNWYEGNNTNKQGPKWTSSCYDQKVFSPTGLVDGCYNFECNSSLNYNSLNPAYDRAQYARFAPYAKIAERKGGSDVVTWGTFPVYGMKILNVGFAWHPAPYAKLWITIGYGIFSVVDPEDFSPTAYFKIFLVSEQSTHDVNNKGWAFGPSDICDAERSSGFLHTNISQITSFTTTEQEAIDRIWASGNEIRITADF